MIFDVKNKRVTVMGLGHFGGGVGVTRWLCQQGAIVTVTDMAPAEKLADSLSQISDLNVKLVLGRHEEEDFRDADMVVTSPAVKPGNAFLQAALSRGIPVTTEIALFAHRCKARVLGVTGTKGKSTTSSLLFYILQSQFPKTLLGGNIGGSLLEKLPTLGESDLVVLELSSFMLYWLGKDKWSPHVGVLTMLGADHLDWHGSMEAYHAAKFEMFAHQESSDFAVANHVDLPVRCGARRVEFAPDGDDLVLQLPGEHNRANARAAIAAAACVGVSRNAAVKAVAQFKGLPHRLELVATIDGVDYINDSIATNPAAVGVALRAFAGRRVIAIVGGRTKGLDDSAILQALATHASHVMCIGEVGDRIAQTLAELGAQATDCRTLEHAVKHARAMAKQGDVVLLSPGYTSYDQFANFEERGMAFARLVAGPATEKCFY
jgi:UDP-N-acetylmuramoylalanine--D-glutamate ligase